MIIKYETNKYKVTAKCIPEKFGANIKTPPLKDKTKPFPYIKRNYMDKKNV